MAFWREGWQARHEHDHLQCGLTLYDILLEACEYVVNRQLAIECQEQSIKVRALKVCYSASAVIGAESVNATPERLLR